ncbi:ABC transporter ATP-binding protein [Enterococcus sp. AZ103]|uniref:ABC transporter ATP-binding protein n=1 Tax=Enterococcus sp. AZ103 TaxID=2774628 RepID=UPI003F2199FE
MHNLVEVRDIRKDYNGNEVLKGIDLTAYPGEVLVVLGKNGAGKSTLFKLIAGLAEQTSGEIQLNQNNIGFSINEPVFYEQLSGWDNLAIHCQYYNVSEEKIGYWLKKVGLSVENQQPVKNYSLGMRQRLVISRCLIHNPDILLIDEPLNGLDPKGIKDFRELLQELKEQNKTIIISSHILSEVQSIANRIVVLYEGKMVLQTLAKDFSTESPTVFENKMINWMEGI